MNQLKRPPLALRIVFLGKHLSHMIERRLASSGFNRTQTIVLRALQHHPGLQPLQLCHPAGVKPANVTRTLQSLERMGLVERRPHPTDGRASIFHLTPKGEERARILSDTVDELSTEMFKSIEPRDLLALEKALDTVMAAIGHHHLAFSGTNQPATEGMGHDPWDGENCCPSKSQKS